MTTKRHLRRAMMFMPGNNPGMLQSAGLFGADTVSFDLEDAVAIRKNLIAGEPSKMQVVYSMKLTYLNFQN